MFSNLGLSAAEVSAKSLRLLDSQSFLKLIVQRFNPLLTAIVPLIIVIILTSVPVIAQADDGPVKLIPVKPAESFETPEPQNSQDGPKSTYPAPRDQMYVFWIAGRIISFPIDLVESFINKQRAKYSTRENKEGKPVPASAGANQNPFDKLNWREIPPAPPVLDRR